MNKNSSYGDLCTCTADDLSDERVDLLQNEDSPLLSEFERLTLMYRSRGYSYEKIGELLHYSPSTIYNFHIRAMYMINSANGADNV